MINAKQKDCYGCIWFDQCGFENIKCHFYESENTVEKNSYLEYWESLVEREAAYKDQLAEVGSSGETDYNK